MIKPEIPVDEQNRLKALRSLDILDSHAEERFDRLTRMAKHMFGAPIALVSLIDENRQWFKSCIGLNVRETARDISFCGHAILGGGVFVIPDATQDARFANNPLVLDEPHIRFYAGCPLKVMEGHKIGTLCIIDQKPRTFSPVECDLLKDLAIMVEKELMALQLAIMDELTQLLNRRGFFAAANNILALCARQKIPATLAFFDLNDFKSINDRFGHAEGDKALIAFAEQLQHDFRKSDAMARLGGDEFVMLLTGTTKQHAEPALAKFKTSLDARNRSARRGYDITFSCGLVDFDAEAHPSIEGLLTQADSLMYAHKVQMRQESPPVTEFRT